VDKYLNGYLKPKGRKRNSKIDEYYDVIRSLLSDGSIQKFYYKRVLWQYLKDKTISTGVHMPIKNNLLKFETPPGE
jgi:transposase